MSNEKIVSITGDAECIAIAIEKILDSEFWGKNNKTKFYHSKNGPTNFFDQKGHYTGKFQGRNMHNLQSGMMNMGGMMPMMGMGMNMAMMGGNQRGGGKISKSFRGKNYRGNPRGQNYPYLNGMQFGGMNPTMMNQMMNQMMNPLMMNQMMMQQQQFMMQQQQQFRGNNKRKGRGGKNGKAKKKAVETERKKNEEKATAGIQSTEPAKSETPVE